MFRRKIFKRNDTTTSTRGHGSILTNCEIFMIETLKWRGNIVFIQNNPS